MALTLFYLTLHYLTLYQDVGAESGISASSHSLPYILHLSYAYNSPTPNIFDIFIILISSSQLPTDSIYTARRNIIRVQEQKQSDCEIWGPRHLSGSEINSRHLVQASVNPTSTLPRGTQLCRCDVQRLLNTE